MAGLAAKHQTSATEVNSTSPNQNLSQDTAAERYSPKLDERSPSPSIKIPIKTAKEFSPIQMAYSFNESRDKSILSVDFPESNSQRTPCMTSSRPNSPISTYLMLNRLLSSNPPRIPNLIMKQSVTDEIKEYFGNDDDSNQDEYPVLENNNEEPLFDLELEPNPPRP